MSLLEIGKLAQQASYELAIADSTTKNNALENIALALEANEAVIVEANKKDIEAGKQAGLTDALLDRLLLDETRLAGIIGDLRSVINLSDPVGEEFDSKLLENGLKLSKRRVPVGVIGVIYEARPNVTIDIAALCLKTGNASILRGGKETINSNLVLVKVIQDALVASGLPKTAVQYIENTDRALVGELLKMDQYVDMIIPRGNSGLQQFCKENSTIPVIIGGIGICHLYAEKSVDMDKALAIIENAKVQRPSVCNALDTLLVEESIAAEFLPKLAALLLPQGVTLVAEPKAKAILGENAVVAQEGDFSREWLSLHLGVKVVATLSDALVHIREHSSQHSDGILTNDFTVANQFVNAVNSAAVYVNASTRFTDGSQFGLGAEVAVSTQKLHARGPMGLQELTTYKWIGIGEYLVRN
ncbi:glutamate-5-semialdehyde dehydrogenase [Psychromonas sp. Urea-02u-13]|uniref:glutamate-5-semialdehyde dehydrogenase n=1 Tax=Psychromonas sp. Urea-02u-13 TaxID=2058326 RepID=UPI000C33E36E|nr:glutamate-5-semialdehyde dehydrogenase [Psychromonas sp. Urea-02u-13]PKG39928.1 glutamate-5-semialdehyde dehydrogenase [Psychromonas sp. Urea-02u-13]